MNNPGSASVLSQEQDWKRQEEGAIRRIDQNGGFSQRGGLYAIYFREILERQLGGVPQDAQHVKDVVDTLLLDVMLITPQEALLFIIYVDEIARDVNSPLDIQLSALHKALINRAALP